MNSPRNLNYETRPSKFTERKMLLSSFQRICNLYNNSYQYIGMGGLAFTDFKLFHKELHINEMFTIEGGDFTIEKIKFNLPYSFVNIHREFTTSALTKIDLTKKSIVWLDYDGCLDNYMFEDLSILMNRLPVGSIYLMSCNRELKEETTGINYTIDEFKSKFSDLVPFDLSNTNFSGMNDYKTIIKMFTNLINNVISQRIKDGEAIKFQQLYNILYQENRGAKMLTFGGVITECDKNLYSLNHNDLEFIKTSEDPYRINIPNLTFKEMDLINNHIIMDPLHDYSNLTDTKIVGKHDIDKYVSIYKFLPAFFDVRV